LDQKGATKVKPDTVMQTSIFIQKATLHVNICWIYHYII